MNLYTLSILAFAMSVDAFAASIAKGAACNCNCLTLRRVGRTALIFGIVETITPLIGWLGGSVAKPLIAEWDHWVAFILLLGLGGKMIYGSLSGKEEDDPDTAKNGFWLTVVTAVATSIDSMIVGVGLAFVEVNIWLAAFMIGTTTTIMSAVGMVLGRSFGKAAGKRAEVLGGIVLIAIGSSILIEHLALLA
ncbi:manganese efflux pump MntP family protein [Neisseria sp. Dent CA1/247]|uniref:manganese efflux pump MntP n=1 Tax=Neisseria sp. Dent CA1/247 TaxID=2912675 RepID=UPI001FD13452|nr:manganese efflux pump MntP family protein [Neisseria sp. Dent CA1/247]UOO77840.1 manganese efflux pump MntP family protein [Neisseria sp. Dent CA1/247]